VNRAPVQLHWSAADQHAAFLGGLRLLNHTRRLSLDALLELHVILLPPTNPQRGRFRDQPIQVRFNGVTHWRPPLAVEAVERTASTLERVNTVMAAGLVPETARGCAARALFEITDLHPFADGNGRVARSVASWILIRGGFALLMDPGIYCRRRVDDYYRALDSKRLDPTLWEQFFDEMVGYCFRLPALVGGVG
jgi:Fic family protein